MSTVTVILACLAGGAGAVLRYALDAVVTRHVGAGLPWGTLVVNVSGAFVLGAVTGVAPALPVSAASVLGAGLLGGYTTFSTASVQTAELITRGRRAAAVASALGMLIAAVLAGGAGIALGRIAAGS
ncbi:MAG: hypothetical protein BGO45_15635 [Microbacterium sp. 71-36]|uniref:fluoride efflux transporter FluC n=1 Tax=unclassified Microbacterium TaxID=2609290 RepID=UPI00086B6FD9|nr:MULTISPECIES: CrcB family protein [unclassified Microbacterium]MBN9212375.1 CrcB family protein [Microbacterium sp.]ODT38685.1 MAG: hypothetical protein ABS60_09640 [Microbacterium sp. SCN 71-17]OJV78104.1 MAG: hypothetical protein BGO45_15635 [Microbacterium sp. 71-36]